MKFLFYAPQMASYGGIERHVCSLAVEAARAGHVVSLLTTSNSLGDELRGELAAASVTFLELPAPRKGAGKLRKLLWLAGIVLRLRREGWDVVYTNGQSALARVVWRAGRTGARRIHHHHTAADAGERATWSPAFRRVLKQAPELVGCSRATCAQLDLATGRSDARFIPYLTRCPVSADLVAERPAGTPLRFGFMGRLVAEKGLDALCRLSTDPALSDIAWEIHGAGPAYPPEFFKPYPLVNYMGPYRGSEAQARVLLGLDALALFSTHNEGMPLSLIEALSAGLPWVATDRGGTREAALAPADTIVVPHPADHEALRAAVRTLADRILAGRTSRVRQRKIYDENFAPPLVARQWLAYLTGNVA